MEPSPSAPRPAPSTIPRLWTRHIADSLQLIDLAPQARIWADLGSGAGFPGLVIALCGMGRKGHMVHLVESNKGKCAFLREAIRLTGAPAEVHDQRVEDFVENAPKQQKTITALALSPLSELCQQLEPLMTHDSLAILPKGSNFQAELTQAGQFWKMDYDTVSSRTDSQAAIIRLFGLRRKS